ncbi:hypothetical protein FOL47_007263 [Perkinsus chesapeaki]|uniref:Uncharacterized protein n=1 Tax=Perkinsus chesapeaki TaxID=330153 RepID=A0A7J6LLQ6_PERCH|nr:hypothetical protein FOL47_007263 [Perkinsus chesapeaki]
MFKMIFYLWVRQIWSSIPVESNQHDRIPNGDYCMDAILPSPSSTINFQPNRRGSTSGNCFISVIDVYNFERQGHALVDAHYEVEGDGWLRITGEPPTFKLNDTLSFPYLVQDYNLKYNKQEDAIELYDLKGKMLAHFSTTLCPDYWAKRLSSSDPPPFLDLYCSDLVTLSIEDDGVARLYLGEKLSYIGGYTEVDKRVPLPIPFGRFAFSLVRVDNSTLKLVPDCVPDQSFTLKRAVTPEERRKCKYLLR